MPETPTWLIPYPEPPDPADVPADVKKLADRLEEVLNEFQTIVAGAGGMPGEVRLWSGAAVPGTDYGLWVWADGASYPSNVHPLAAAHIAAAWRTHGGKPDPGAGNFRVPDLRGSVPVGLDAMPGGARANRLTRAIAATLAGVTGEEYHTLAQGEMPSHNHPLHDPTHTHGMVGPSIQMLEWVGGGGINASGGQGGWVSQQLHTHGVYGAGTGISLDPVGGGGAHENVPPATFVPWIVKLD